MVLSQDPVGRALRLISDLCYRLWSGMTTSVLCTCPPWSEALLVYQARAACPRPALRARGVFATSRATLVPFPAGFCSGYLHATSVCVSVCLCVWGAGFAGTPGYLSPEVLRKDPYGKPVDLWACGESVRRRLYAPRCLSLSCPLSCPITTTPVLLLTRG